MQVHRKHSANGSAVLAYSVEKLLLPGQGWEHMDSCRRRLPLCLHLDLSDQCWEPSCSYPGDWGFLGLNSKSANAKRNLKYVWYVQRNSWLRLQGCQINFYNKIFWIIFKTFDVTSCSWMVIRVSLHKRLIQGSHRPHRCLHHIRPHTCPHLCLSGHYFWLQDSCHRRHQSRPHQCSSGPRWAPEHSCPEDKTFWSLQANR